jgi:MFS family permease
MNFWELLRHPRLSRLLGVRWSGQATDGLFQSALASFVLFSPERQADALSAAVAFAVVLLPYSIVGPFVGTILDRVSRQRALLFSNLARAINLLVIAWLVFAGQTGIELTIFVLIAFGINRLILAGLSAGLPLMIETKSLISANALAVTGGSVLVVLGGGLGVAIRNLFDYLAVADHADAIMVLFAAGGYLTAALLSLRVGRKEIGPLPHEVKEASFKEGIIEMREGFAFLRGHSDAIRGILATAVQRGGITALTLTALLLERNTFNSPTDPEAGLKGFGIVLTIAGIGITLGALNAPYGVARFGRHRWIKWSLLAGAAGPLFLVFSQTPIALALTGFSVALCGQNVKVTNDALVQSKIDDYYRGRVFAVYDVLVNGAIVSGGLIAALLLPTSGVTPWVPALVSAIYLLVALRLLRPEKFFLKV